MQIVKVQALPREGFAFRPRAGRFFPSGQIVTLEVVEGDEDPSIEVEKTDAAGKKFKERKPDPARISRKVFDTMIMTDSVLRVLSDGETTSELSDAAMAAARKQGADLASELVVVKAKLAFVTEELGKAKARIAELEAQLGAAPTVPTVTPETTEEERSAGKPARAKR